MMRKLGKLSVLILLLNMSAPAQKSYEPNWQSIDSRPVPAWFEDAKFGIFIHWGVFSVPAYSPTVRDKVGVYERYAEWYWNKLVNPSKTQQFFIDYHTRMYGKDAQYQNFASQFKAEMFNPDEWAERFKQAGAQYIVLTSKHHEGFTLWPSAQSWNWNAMDVGPHRDLCGDLTKSVKAKGLHMGFYYSLYEWFNPLYKSNLNQYVDNHMIPQMKDLVTRYQPDVLWTDGEWEKQSADWKSPQFLSWLYNESPVKNSIVVNDRWGKDTRGKHGGFYTTEYDLVDDKNASEASINHPWEECRGMAGSFGYNRNEVLEDYSTSKELIDILINKVARGGNLLLNIGPTADGRIPELMQQRLADMGAWLKINGEGIYATRKWSKTPAINNNSTVFYTTKGHDLYAIITKWQDSPIVIEGIAKPTAVNLLGYNGAVKSDFSKNKLKVTPPTLSPSTNPSPYAWVFKLENAL